MKSQKELESITTEEIEKYYNEENHSQRECAEHYGISVGMFIRLLKKRGIHKDKSKHTEKIKQRKLEKYGNPNYNNRDKAKETCLEKYGVDNLFKDTEYMKQSYIKELGVEHPMKRDDIKNKVVSQINYEESIRKGRETYKQKTGYDNPGKDPKCIDKMLKTKIKNGVFSSPGTSNEERRLEKILKRKFKEVLTRYHDNRYSRSTGYTYECDFYIPEEDLFIELNAHYTHYNHPYKYKKEDDSILESLLKSDKEWHKILIDTWTKRDTEKIECARKNNLNYIVLYPTSSIHDNKQFNDKKYSDLIEYLIKKLNKK